MMSIRWTRLVVAAGIVAGAAVAVGHAFQTSPADRPWPAPVPPVAAEVPARTPADEAKTFYMPPGYHVELVASEPMVSEPIFIDWDAQGRMWVIEMIGYMNDITAAGEHDPVGQIVVLEDTNHDGVMDKRTVFADHLIAPRALKVLDHGVLVGEPPNLWLMKDTNGDLRADTKELVSNQYGQLDANVEHNANGLTWALDNWMYTSEIDIFLRLKQGTFDVEHTLSRGQWGNSQDDWGHIYRNTNESVLHVDLVPTQYYARNPNLLRTRGSYESLEGDHNEVNAVWPAHATPGVNRGYQTGILRSDGSLANYTSVSSPTVYRGDRLPAELRGNVFVTEPAANLVSRIIVSDDGKTIRAKKAYEGSEFLASTDERFRPVYLSSAPDGTLYIVDIYHGIIQHKGFITEYLRDQILSRDLQAPIHYGRIWRVVHDTTTRGPAPSLGTATPAELVNTLSHPNGWWRDTAQRLLVERGDASAVPALKRLVLTATDPRTKLHALWTLDGTDAIDVPTVLHALADPSRDVRVSAIRVAERWMGDAKSPVQAALAERIADPDWNVQEQLAASFGALPAPLRETRLAALLEKDGDNPVVVDAALSGVRGDEIALLQKLQAASDDTPQRDASLTMTAATVVRGGQDSAVQEVFRTIADRTRPKGLRSALLLGAEVALVGAPAPGTPAVARRGGTADANPGAAAPCPTCAGGRSGPGGAPAFPAGGGNQAAAGGRATAAAAGAGRGRGAAAGGRAAGGATAGRGGRGGGPLLRLNHEPMEFAALAGSTDELAARASAVLDRVVWPGKPGAPAPVAPLTPDEQRRFDAGQVVYKSICLPCHQADGRGAPKIAANLIGSPLALAPAEVTARILMNGKEGSIGLMPPLGASLSDEQIADVLTYIRRDWGQDGTPVDPATVKSVRALTASRTRPWTNDELLALVPTSSK